MKAPVFIALLCSTTSGVAAYNGPSFLSRRDFGRLVVASSSAARLVAVQPVQAFEGTGSSAYSGRSPASKAEMRRGYQARIAADVRDFNTLGAAIAKGEADLFESDAWKFFFIPFPRKNADAVGRTYAALADLIGHPGERGQLEGGDGYLLAATFTKAGKPPDNTPAVKSYNALSKAFGPIKAAGEKRDAAKAREAWNNASVLFSKYLEEVDMPGNLDDPLYR